MKKVVPKQINCNINFSASKRRSKGAGLIEVLIAALVLSVGILGYVGMQLNAKRLNFEAIQRTTAVNLAQNILERIRSNPVGLSNGNYVNTSPLELDPGTLAEPAKNCINDQCNTSELAAFDLWEWDQLIDGASVSGGLVNPMACISVESNYITVTIVWQGKTELNDAAAPDCGVDNYPGDQAALRQWITLNTFVADV